MKWLAAVGGAVAGITLIGVIAWLLMPNLRGGSEKAAAGPVTPPVVVEPATGPQAAPAPSQPLPTPITQDEQTRRAYARQREPFLQYIRETYRGLVSRVSAAQDLDTIDLVITQADDASIGVLVRDAIGPNARLYGFRRARFYLYNVPGSVEPLQLVAESTQNDTGGWTIYRK